MNLLLSINIIIVCIIVLFNKICMRRSIHENSLLIYVSIIVSIVHEINFHFGEKFVLFQFPFQIGADLLIFNKYLKETFKFKVG